MRLRLVAIAALAALAACGPLHVKPKVKPFPYDGWSSTYPTGLRLVAYELPHQQEVMVSASYAVGSVDDPPGKEGLAHLVEHLAFRSKPDGGPRIWNRLEALAGVPGAHFNAVTYEDSTDYWAIAAPAALDDLLRMEADRLRDPLAGVTEKEFLREREVVLRELAERRDPASPVVQLDWLVTLALPGSPYARVATVGSLRAITFDDVRAFVRTYYTPAHVIVAVTGPTMAATVGSTTVGIFGQLAASGGGGQMDPVRPRPPPFDFASPVPTALERRTAPVSEPILWLAWSVPGDAAKPGAPRAIAAADFLGSMAFFSAIGPNRERVTGLEAFPYRMDGVSLVVARIALRSAADAERVLDAFRSWRRYWGGTSGAELFAGEDVRDELLMSGHLALEALEVPEIARFVRTSGNPDYIAGWQRLVALELSTQSKPYVESYLRSDRLVAMLVAPEDRAPVAPGVSPSGIEPREADHHGPPPEPELAAGDPVAALRGATALQVSRHTLDNGLRVVIVPRAGFRAVQLRLACLGGAPGQTDALVAQLALATSADDRGAIGPDHLAFTARFPTEQLSDSLLALARRCRFGRSVDGFVYERVRDSVAKLLEARVRTAQEIAGAALLSALYPDHAYGADLDVARFRAADGGDARRWLERCLRPDRAVLVLAGDVTPGEELLDEVKGLFGGWHAPSDVSPPRVFPALPAARRVVIVDRPGWETAELVVGVRAPLRSDRDEPAFRANLWRLDSGLNGRLRLSQPLTYGVSVDVLDRTLGPSLLLRTVVARERAASTVAELLGSLAALTEPLDDGTLARARWQVALAVSTGFGTSKRNATRLEELFVHGLADDEWNTFAARTASLTSARITAEAGKLATGTEVIVLVGDAAAIGPALRSRGFTPEVIANPPALSAR